MGRTLYATDDQKRYFLVPDEATLPKGDFVVRSLTGRKLAVDGTVLDVFEIPEEEAKKVVQAQLREFGSKMRGVLGAAAQALSPGPAAARDPGAARDEKAGAPTDADQLAAALGSLVKGVLSTAAATVNDPAMAEARMKDVASALKQEGLDEADAAKVAELPGKLRELLQSEETLKALDEMTEKLQAAARQLDAELEADRLTRLAKAQTPGEA